ncbi:hypothetical protein [Micromonospora sp. KC213]|uniref:hypothetical protein n=1 Tax=Micromonospora sp. KC213 TaxID=2530378 RepID=UPI001048201F|nr:hypothetical protein [Micromonospora sp. KC213]TDC42170.1 hypothetical protein E1166_08815 [Micromonospora sp. KC213]
MTEPIGSASGFYTDPYPVLARLRESTPVCLDITRERGPHLGLGHGVHYCLAVAWPAGAARPVRRVNAVPATQSVHQSTKEQTWSSAT